MDTNYFVIDSTNHIVRAFKTLKEAQAFKVYNSRYDWRISYLKSTER